MRLYHGTSAATGRIIMEHGLHPRSVTEGEEGKGNWEHTIPSNPECVYLTTAYAAYFAINAMGDDEKEIAIVEVESDDLDPDFFRPDEDFMEQASRNATLEGDGFDGLIECGDDMNKRTEWFRDNGWKFGHMWEQSIESLGNCCYEGGIDASDILRVSFVDVTKAASMATMAMDPTISLLNFGIMQGKYRSLTQWFMGEAVKPEAISTWGLAELGENNPLQKQANEQLAALGKLLADQSMIRVEEP